MVGNDKLLIKPNPGDRGLTEEVEGVDQDGSLIKISVTVERPLTLFLNSQEIVTMMSICDYPEFLAVGYLVNQNMISDNEQIIKIEYEEDIETVIVRTNQETNFEGKLRKKTLTSGCAQGTVFGDLMEKFDEVDLSPEIKLRTSDLYRVLKNINTTPSLYLEAGAIHGCVLFKDSNPILFMEDVGRHNAVDKIAGYMFLNDIPGNDKMFYTTGRLTSEMVIKTVQMGIPILVSRSGFTAWGVDLAKQADLTLVGRARGERFIVLAADHRIEYV
jgi:FdhD protein